MQNSFTFGFFSFIAESFVGETTVKRQSRSNFISDISDLQIIFLEVINI
jgi:hypothetical protein